MKKKTWGANRSGPVMKRPEQDGQIAIFNFLRAIMVRDKYKTFIAFAVPNGGRRTKAEAIKLIQSGVMAGAADIVFCFRSGKTVFVENKVLPPLPRERLKKDGTPIKLRERRIDTGQSGNQKDFEERVRALGYEYRIVAWTEGDLRSAVDQVIEILRESGVKV